MRNLFTRSSPNKCNSIRNLDTLEAKPLISFEIDIKTVINIKQRDLVKIFGLITLGTGLSFSLGLGSPQIVSPHNEESLIRSEAIYELS